jgi:hypothetical protein
MLININNKLSDVNGRDDDKMKNSHCDLLNLSAQGTAPRRGLMQISHQWDKKVGDVQRVARVHQRLVHPNAHG